MDEGEPRLRRRGFFLHSSDTGEPDTGEHENPEGITVRIRIARAQVSRQVTSVARRVVSASRPTSGRSRTETARDDTRPAIRSGSVTGSRQRAH
jgi:hypothetical protein